MDDEMDELGLIICKKSLTYHRGEIVTDFSPARLFKPDFYEGEAYKFVVRGNHIFINFNDSYERFVYIISDKLNSTSPLYNDYFLSISQSKRILRLKQLGI